MARFLQIPVYNSAVKSCAHLPVGMWLLTADPGQGHTVPVPKGGLLWCLLCRATVQLWVSPETSALKFQPLEFAKSGCSFHILTATRLLLCSVRCLENTPRSKKEHDLKVLPSSIRVLVPKRGSRKSSSASDVHTVTLNSQHQASSVRSLRTVCKMINDARKWPLVCLTVHCKYCF